MRYNWNALINAVAYLTDEPEADGPLTGKGYSVERQGAGSFVIHVSELAASETPENAMVEVPATPETPNLAPVVSPPAPVISPEVQTPAPSVPVVASESAPIVSPTEILPAPTPTGQGGVATSAVPTGQ